MKAALISLGSESSGMVVKAMKKYFKEVDSLDLRNIEINLELKKGNILYRGEPLKQYDCIYLKGSFRYRNIMRALAQLLEGTCFMPITPAAFTITQDKVLSQLTLQQQKIPMPATYLSATISAAKGLLKKVNYPIVMKFPQGTQGKGVMFADSYASASSLLDALIALKQPFLIQEYIETDGTDIRALVVGDNVVASMKRIAETGEKRSNIHAGGKGVSYPLDDLGKKIAVDAARAIGADICGVDLLETIKGYAVIEVNVSPGLQGISAATNIDIADKIAKYLYENTLERTEGRKAKESKKIMSDMSSAHPQEIIMNLDFRGQRILLPENISKISRLSSQDEVSVKADKGSIIIKKFGS